MNETDERSTIPLWTRSGSTLSHRPHINTTRTRLHILMPCHEYPPIGGGASAVCHALARHYVAAGHRVCVVTMGFEDLPEQERLDGVDVHRVACGRQRREMSSPWECLTWARRSATPVRQLDQRDPFDIIHAHFIMPGGIVGSRLKHRFGTPLTITLHGSDVPGHNRERLQMAHALARPWWRRICRAADAIVSPSHNLAKLFEKQMRGVPIHVIPNGFDPQRFRPLSKQRRILLCSRLLPQKGFQNFLEAVRTLDLPGWAIDIVGDGPMHDELARLANQCRIPVTMHGWLDNNSRQLAELYGHAMIMALPSERENCSIALLEAMSAGCAIITTNTCGSPEVVADCGLLLPPGNSEALRIAVLDLTRDPQRCQDLGSRASRRAMIQFDWSKLARRYQDLFHHQLALRGAAA